MVVLLFYLETHNTSQIPNTLEWYIQNVSPVTKASSSNRHYFSCTFQCKDGTARAVCFSPEKHSQLHTVAQTRSPLKIQNFTKPDKGKHIFIKFTNITAPDKDKISFEFMDGLTAISDGIINISSIYNLAPEQLITVRGEVTNISAVKLVATSQGKLKKQELLIRDTTPYKKVILWENHVETVELNKTYQFRNLRVKASKQERCLNTPKNEPFEATKCEEFQRPLVKIDQDIKTSSTITSKILGIRHKCRVMARVSCKKEVLPKTNTAASGMCQPCHL